MGRTSETAKGKQSQDLENVEKVQEWRRRRTKRNLIASVPMVILEAWTNSRRKLISAIYYVADAMPRYMRSYRDKNSWVAQW